MKLTTLAAALLCCAGAAAADCGPKALECECAAVFRVLDVPQDRDLEARLRQISGQLQWDVSLALGERAAEQMIKQQMQAWTAPGNEAPTSLDLAATLARCDRFVTGAEAAPEIVIAPKASDGE